jgi:hypothetical protein
MNKLLPAALDNTYRGAKFALWLFALFLLMKFAMALNSIFNGAKIAASADGIPLATFSAGAAATVISLFALLGFSHFMFALLGLITLVRYRGMIPLMFALFLLEFLGRRLILQFLPIPRTGTPSAVYVNVVLLVLMIGGLVLSISRGGRQTGVESR